jgi:hypothetical protein
MRPKFREQIKRRKLRRLSPEFRQQKNWIADYKEFHKAKLREKIVAWTLPVFAGLVVTTTALLLLQGFRPFGFALPETTFTWVVRIVIGEAFATLAVVVRFVFK